MPQVLCEYAHAMGNSTGGLHLYTDAFDDPALPSLQGGFIWDWYRRTTGGGAR